MTSVKSITGSGKDWTVAQGKRSRASPDKTHGAPSKQKKLSDYWLGPAIENRFSTLENEGEKNPDEEMSSDVSDNVNKKNIENPGHEPRPPPVFIYNVERLEPLKTLLQELTNGDFSMKILSGNQVRVQLMTADSYRCVLSNCEGRTTKVEKRDPSVPAMSEI
uniref:Uncharacterized protein n=1 Tax=Phlebotomus papatasi TaxID=29031 RepID=A0A1B0GNP8_PHLPP